MSELRSGDEHVSATYQEIADRFGLAGPNVALTKAKRAGWPRERSNRPGGLIRVRVPRELWEQAGRPRNRVAIQPNERATISQAVEMGELRGQLVVMAEQLERERTRGDVATEQVQELTGRVGELTGKLEAMQDELAARRAAGAIRPPIALLDWRALRDRLAELVKGVRGRS